MKIAVCINHVPDTSSKISITSDSKNVEVENLDFIINPYDEFAVEEALVSKEKLEAEEVIVISVGDERNKDSLKKALAMGADRAIHLRTDIDYDSLGLAHILADEIKSQGCELVFLGKQSIDQGNSVTGAILAELLSFNLLSNVNHLEISSEKLTAIKEIDGGKEKVATNFPAVITAEKGLNSPRYPSLKGIMAAKKKPFEEKQIELEIKPIDENELFKPPVKSAGQSFEFSDETLNGFIGFLKENVKII